MFMIKLFVVGFCILFVFIFFISYRYFLRSIVGDSFDGVCFIVKRELDVLLIEKKCILKIEYI